MQGLMRKMSWFLVFYVTESEGENERERDVYFLILTILTIPGVFLNNAIHLEIYSNMSNTCKWIAWFKYKEKWFCSDPLQILLVQFVYCLKNWSIN